MDLQNKKIWVFAVIICLSIILHALFLNSSGFMVLDALDLSTAGQSIGKILSIEFILFLVSFPLAYAVAIVMCRFLNKTDARLAAVTGTLAGGILSLVLFEIISSYILICAFYFFSMIVITESAHTMFKETKSLIYVRVIANAAGKALLLLGMGIFLVSVLTIFDNQQMYVDNFEEAVVSMISENEGLNYSDMGADLIIESQKQTLDLIIDTPMYTAIENKQDTEVRDYVSFISALRISMNTPQYKELLKQKMEEQDTGTEDITKNAFNMVKKQLPMLIIIEDYFWFIGSFLAASLFFLVGNLIFRPLAVIYGTIFGKLAEAAGAEVVTEE